MPVITISRDFASGGRKLGRMLAKGLDYQYVDKSLFQKIAEDLNVSEKTLESFEKSREYRISNVFSRLFSKNYIERIVGHDKSVVEEQEYQSSLKNLILGVAQEDNVVIIGRAAYFFLKDMENCYHIRLFATMDWRKKYAVENRGTPRGRVQEIIDKRDINELWFRRFMCGESFDDQSLFHLNLNMGLVAFEKAVDVIMALANL
ncbi:MAG: cytidylate kinase-like family protein [Desulfobacterales bacterium]